jgi:hypothetical protein
MLLRVPRYICSSGINSEWEQMREHNFQEGRERGGGGGGGKFTKVDRVT